MRLGRIGKLFARGYTWCFRCRTPWKFVEPHTTDYEWGDGWARGCFALCEECWAELETPTARLPFYEMLFAHPGRSDSAETQRTIRKAVLRESASSDKEKDGN